MTWRQDELRKIAAADDLRVAPFQLTPEDLREIESAASNIRVQGDRYPESLERLTGR